MILVNYIFLKVTKKPGDGAVSRKFVETPEPHHFILLPQF
jgi:hypothetical protein